MLHTTLCCGIHKAAEGLVETASLNITVGQHIEQLLQADDTGPTTKQLHSLLQNPHSVIEVRAGDQVQVASADMPLRELMPVGGKEVEITVSEPHVGG